MINQRSLVKPPAPVSVLASEMNLNQRRNQHVWWRAGFGPPVDQVSVLHRQKPEELFHRLWKASEEVPKPLDVISPELRTLLPAGGGWPEQLKLTPEDRQALRKQSVEDIAKLNILWIREMKESPSQLREKTALFWHGHFASKTINIFYDQQLLQIIRENALGDFRTLLLQVCKSGSVIQFLNNNQNKKSHPNENFARELMELFTMGRGHYSELDIKEAARSFTGWGTNLRGDFVFRMQQHDTGTKTFLGKTGNLTGEEIIDIILNQKSTAIFITRKLYKYFVNEQLNENEVNALADLFYDSNYDIGKLLTRMFTSSWFFDEKNIGTQIKSPVLWMVGLQRQLPMDIQNPRSQLILERLLGQVLFAPPNVAGWPGGKHWIDSSSLMLRLQLPARIFQTDFTLVKPKDDDDLMMGMKESFFSAKKIKTGGSQMFQARILWDQFIRNFDETKDMALDEAVENVLVQRPVFLNSGQLDKYIDYTSRDKNIQTLAIRIMGTPEYQLC